MTRRMITIAMVAAVIAVLVVQTAQAPSTRYDDPLWIARGERAIWTVDRPADRFLAVDVPGLCRLAYWLPLRLVKGRGASIPTDYTLEPRANARRGAHAQPDKVLWCRLPNLIAFLGGLLCLYAAALNILKSPWWAVVPLAPFLISPTFPLTVLPRLGPDVFLFAGLCAFLAVWLWLHERNRAGDWVAVVLMGIFGGICVSAKINGALVLIAYCVWLCRRHPVKAICTGLLAFCIFYGMNPGFYGLWPHRLVRAILERRLAIIAQWSMRYEVMGRTELLSELIPCWPVVPVFVVAMWQKRREWWAGPVMLWGSFLTAGTLLSVNKLSACYSAPAELGLFFAGSLAVVVCLLQPRHPVT